MSQFDDLDPETKARIEAEEAYRAQVRSGQTQPTGAARATPAAPAPGKKKGPSLLKIGCGGFLFLVLLSALFGGSGDKDTPVETSTSAPAVETEAPPTAEEMSPTPEPTAPEPAAPAATDGRHRMVRMAVACPEKEDYSRYISFIVQKDQQAAASHAVTHGCTVFEEGEEVFLDDVAVLSGMTKVRRQGDPTGYWTAFEAVD